MGALLLGAVFGVVSSPCATTVLVALLGLVATQREVAYGISLLFVYALGHCLLMLAAGTFTLLSSVADAVGAGLPAKARCQSRARPLLRVVQSLTRKVSRLTTRQVPILGVFERLAPDQLRCLGLPVWFQPGQNRGA